MGQQYELMDSAQLLEVYRMSKTATAIHRGPNAVIQSANEAMLRIWGKDSSVIGKPFIQALPELGSQPYPEMLSRAWTNGETIAGKDAPATVEINGEKGEYFFDFEFLPIRDAEGNILAVMNSAIDVTERVLKNRAIENANESAETLKRLEETNEQLREAKQSLRKMNSELEHRVAERLIELTESEERFRLMAENTELLISVGDENNKRLYFNRQWEKVTGRDIKDLMTKGWVDLIHPDEKELFLEGYHTAFGKREVFETEFRLPDSSGHYRWYLCQCPPRFRSDGKFAGYIASCIDITLRKNEELRKNEFIGTISHELRTPLTSLNGFIQVMRAKLQIMDRSFLESALAKAQNQINKMSAMVNGFLDISRLEAGKMNLSREHFQLDGLVGEIIEEFLYSQTTHKIRFESTCSFDVYADRNKIAAVVSNLLSNSVKYTPYGSLINIICRPFEDKIIVTVSDEGPGIESSELKKIFSRYYRANSTPSISGFGIGLFLCSEIISKHGGSIWAESEIGHGSKFHFTLPHINTP